jgi:hypothetical protein
MDSVRRAGIKTRLRVLLAVALYLAEFGGLVALLAVPLGAFWGFLIALTALAVATVTYLGLFRRWVVRWGATDDEARRPMPGDDIVPPSARCTTRAVTVGVPASQVWPWLAQLGYGRAGWYSSSHLFGTGGKRGTDQIRPEWQQLRPGDRILVLPGTGFDVVAVEDGHYFAARTPDGSTSWCLAVEPLDQHSCRLISRWRSEWYVAATSATWLTVSEPSAFITERRMLLEIKARAEQATRTRSPHVSW